MANSASFDLHDRIQASITTILSDLFDAGSFEGLLGGWKSEAVLEATNFEMPCGVTSIEGEQEEPSGNTTLYRYVKFPVRIFILATDLELPTDKAKVQGWRATIFDNLEQRKQDPYTRIILPDCPEVIDIRLTPKVVFDERLKQYRYVVSGFLAKVEAKIRRA